LVLTACGGSSKPKAVAKLQKHTISGTLALNYAGGLAFDDHDCVGVEGYDDISAGAAVTVTNQSGTIVGTGSLSSGTGSQPIDSGYDDDNAICTFRFTVAVPKATFYKIAVSHRDGVTFSYDKLASSDWTAALSLGS
jgi:hypothetical protein